MLLEYHFYLVIQLILQYIYMDHHQTNIFFYHNINIFRKFFFFFFFFFFKKIFKLYSIYCYFKDHQIFTVKAIVLSTSQENIFFAKTI